MEIFTARDAWRASTRKTEDISERIEKTKEYILNTIQDTTDKDNPPMYHCIVKIDNDLLENANEIFNDFTNAGFLCINLSERLSEITEVGIYLISWEQYDKQSKKDLLDIDIWRIKPKYPPYPNDNIAVMYGAPVTPFMGVSKDNLNLT